MLPRFDPACVSPLDRSHDDTDEEEHLSLLHAVKGSKHPSKSKKCIPCVQFIPLHDLIPGKVEALVSEKTQRELQTGEQEEVAEIDQAQHFQFLHSWRDVFHQSAELFQKWVKRE